MKKICVVGLGYAGLTLAAALADKGFAVWGYDCDEGKAAALRSLRPPFYEPGVLEVLQQRLGRSLQISARFEPLAYDVIIIAVSTPVDPQSHEPVLDHIEAAVREVSANLVGEPLVIIRSTVPAGTTEQRLLPILRAVRPGIPVAYAPERTIQGQALRELVELPQVVGGVDERSRDLAVAFFAGVAQQVVPVSSARAAEFIKLINNAHTDVIYSFGNQVAMLAQALDIDPVECIRAANQDYPRPRIHWPGYVGGGCLTKDPYLLLYSAPSVPAHLIAAARQLNENLPAYTVERVLAGLRSQGLNPATCRLAVCGVAFKGRPATDDVRGTQATGVIAGLAGAGARVYGHDPLVPADRIAALGAEPLALVCAASGLHGYVFLTDHDAYRRLALGDLLGHLQRPALLFDAWRLFRRQEVGAAGVLYQSIGV